MLNVTSETIGSRHFSEALAACVARAPGDRVSLRHVVEFMERRSIGALLLVFALPMVIPIPAPGISVAFGIPLILVSIQLFLGLPHAWLPRQIADREIARASLADFAKGTLPWLMKLEHVARPRLQWLVEGWITHLAGAVCAAMGVIIALPIPLGHFVPGTAISLIALGLLERDGLLIAIGLLVAAVALAVVTLASSAFVGLIHTMALPR